MATATKKTAQTDSGLRTCLAHLESLSPYSQSGFFVSEKNPKESAADFEERCWRERLHVDADDMVVIPAMALKYAIDEAQKRLGTKVEGEGNTRWTKYLESGVMVAHPVNIGIKAETVQPEWIWADSKGDKSSKGGSRVRRCYPTMPEWEATAEFTILNPKIPTDIFEEALKEAGLFVGIGRFRPENQGYYGRFKVVGTTWS